MHEKGLLRADGNVGFDTATGRIELWCSMYNNLGLEPAAVVRGACSQPAFHA